MSRMNGENMRRLLSGSCLAVALLLTLRGGPAQRQALPEYATQTGEPCATCHISPSGGGLRTPRGQAWVGSDKPGAVPALAAVAGAAGRASAGGRSGLPEAPGAVSAGRRPWPRKPARRCDRSRWLRSELPWELTDVSDDQSFRVGTSSGVGTGYGRGDQWPRRCGTRALLAGRRTGSRGRRRPQPLDGQRRRWVKTTCALCPSGCGLEVRVVDGRAVKVEGNPLHPLNQGVCCLQGPGRPGSAVQPRAHQPPAHPDGRTAAVGDWAGDLVGRGARHGGRQS